MQFALVNGIKTEAKIGLKGFCQFCDSVLISKCGEVKMHHWSHNSMHHCDTWWENETVWHRQWKNQYEKAWQEYPFQDERTKEKHIADVYTKDNLVIEFQHSHINTIERKKREAFYREMVWVVDGTRLKHTFKKFLRGKWKLEKFKGKKVFKLKHADNFISNEWLESSVPVILDFYADGRSTDDMLDRLPLYCIFPVKYKDYTIISKIERDAFIKATKSEVWKKRVKKFIEEVRLLDPKLNKRLGVFRLQQLTPSPFDCSSILRVFEIQNRI